MVPNQKQVLEQHFRNLNVTINDNAPAYVNDINRTDYDDLILNEPITEEEIIAASKKLKNNKSPGDDNYANEYIKASIKPMIRCYVGLFNKILDTGVYPEAWTVGLIIPIYKKKGDRMDSNNYRGVTLLSCIGKLFTSVFNERLKVYCESNKITRQLQSLVTVRELTSIETRQLNWP